jgi:glycosyltransferase involved in cell wall biosynthesis
MKIAQVAPLFESVPPRLYGGTERVVSYLTEELVRQGHNVTLFASGDSMTMAELVPCTPRALRLNSDIRDPLPHMMVMLDKLSQRAKDFDVVHFHIDYLHMPLCRLLNVPQLTTLHGRQDLPDHMPLYQRFADMPLVSISNAQRVPLPSANFIRTVYHGLPLDLHQPNTGQTEGYLAFLGRISPEKRPDRAIEIARRAGMRLMIAAKVDRSDEAYFRNAIEPLIDGEQIQYIGEIKEAEKGNLLSKAAALLFPIDWPEPFGLVMIEAMACGTPVIAFPCGSVPEIVEEGLTGRIVASVEEAVEAVRSVATLNRATIRARFEERFSSAQMAAEYVALYRGLIPLPTSIKSFKQDVLPIALASGPLEVS